MPILIKGAAGGKNPTKEMTIPANGDYDVTDYAKVYVRVPEPSGTTTITENGEYYVKPVENVIVNVASESPKEVAIWVDDIEARNNAVVVVSWADALAAAGITSASSIKGIKYLSLSMSAGESGNTGLDTMDCVFYYVPAASTKRVRSSYIYESAAGGTLGELKVSDISSVGFDLQSCIINVGGNGIHYSSYNDMYIGRGVIVLELY